MSSSSDLFGKSLKPDPAVALPRISVSSPKTGPLHRVELIIELVGPRSVPAPSLQPLLQPTWTAALGEPRLWAMQPADTAWAPLDPSRGGSFDSVAASWDLVSERGQLSSASAHHLLATAERFAAGIGRRAVAIPAVTDVDAAVASLLDIRANLDTGVALMVLKGGGVPERDLWIQCARLGLEMEPDGAFAWKAEGHGQPLFSVTPVGDTERFSLAGVTAGAVHQGVTLGFSLPRCPDPLRAWEGLARAARTLADSCGAQIFDEDVNPFDASAERSLGSALRQGADTLQRLGLAPGTSEALRLFSP